MLYGYPLAAVTNNNWVHEALLDSVRTVHQAAARGQPCPRWPSALPSGVRDKLKKRPKLKSLLQQYSAAIREAKPAVRKRVLQALESQNQIAELLAGTVSCERLEGFPEPVRTAISELFEYGFDLLAKEQTRDRHYKEIYEAIAHKVCPFCGTERFDSPERPRESLDHYLVRSSYGFAAANLRNLVPMGGRCNSSYKMTEDLLRKADGSSRTAFDPYVPNSASLDLDDSEPPAGGQKLPTWKIRFSGDAAKVTTWLEVFQLEDRHRDQLNADYLRWLNLFRGYFKRLKWAVGDQEIVQALRNLEEMGNIEGLTDRAFMRVAVFRFLRKRYEARDAKIVGELQALAS